MTGRRLSRSSVAVLVSIAVGAVAGLLVTAAALDDDGPLTAGVTTTSRSRTTVPRTVTTTTRPSTTPPSSTTTTSTTIPPPPASPPAPGRYTYAETADGEDGETVERTYTVEDRPPSEGEERAPGELHFLVTLETEGGRVTTITSWSAEVVMALQTFFRLPETEARCDWNPDLLQLALPIEVDATWSYATSCTADFGSQEVQIDREGEVSVSRAERLAVAGEEVDAWRMESKETTRFRGAIRRTDQEIRTWWFSPGYGLTVKEQARQRHTTPDGTTDETVRRELVELRPV